MKDPSFKGKDTRKSIGSAGEKMAARFLEEKGLKILEHNFRVREGEIDLICLDDETIVFTEVKTRRNTTCGYPVEAIDVKKQEKLRCVAEIYLAKNGWMDRDVRYDTFTLRFDGEKGKWLYHWQKQAF
ncbi:MAG: YraN family protein [Firmicutes bacterium]|nr:YraN family protein [Bacillota bacterium]